MESKRGGKRRMSTFELKENLTALLAGELEGCGFDIVLGFESSVKDRVCTLKFGHGKHVEVCANLGHVKKAVCIGGSQMLGVWYCALFIAEYLKQIERAKKCVPQGYFEGMAYLNAIEVCKAGKRVSVCSPLSRWDKRPKRSCCLRPLEAAGAVNALNKMRLFAPAALNERERAAVRTFCDGLLLYAGLPEVAYAHAGVPVYALADSLKKLAARIDRDPGLVREFPVLSLAPFEKIGQLTVNDLLGHCARADNAFLAGISVRLAAFLLPPQSVTLADGERQRVEDGMKRYIDQALIYCGEAPEAGGQLLSDNLFAVKTAVRSINDYLTLWEAGASAGNIHLIG